jgi:hypothetical protein
MNPRDFNLKKLLAMAHSPVKNYIIPGLTSSLIGGQPGIDGCVRLFQCERDHQENITPHSHRFSFQCWVIEGTVTNRIWQPASAHAMEVDQYAMTTLKFDGMGNYERDITTRHRFHYQDYEYVSGECYSMTATQIHSIRFSRGAVVLFFEGPQERENSVILEPIVDNEVIPTFKVEPWMFKRN